MLKRTQIKIKPCKCGCGKPYTVSCNGYNFNCIPKLEQTEKVNKHQQSKRKAQIRSFNRKKVHDAQREVSGADFFLKKTAVRQKPIPLFSKKRLADIKIYSVLRKDFLNDRLVCEAKLEGCNKKTVDVHHLFSGRDRNKYFTVVETWKAVCRSCHRKIHDELSTEPIN